MNIRFSTQIILEKPTNFSTKFYNKCESYWSLGERKAMVVKIKDKNHLFVLNHSPLSSKKKFKAVILRAAIGTTGIIPLIMLIGKLHLRKTHHFNEFQANNSSILSQESPLPKNPPIIPAKSTLPFKEMTLPDTKEKFIKQIKDEGTTLTKLNLNCFAITDDELKQTAKYCPNLTELIIHSNQITNVDVIRSFKYLQSVEFHHCSFIQGPNFSELAKLKSITIESCKEMTDAPLIKNCTSLANFKLAKCSKLSETVDFSNLPNLRKVILANCPKMEKTPLFTNCSSLEEVAIENIAIEEGPDFSGMVNLKKIYLSELHNLKLPPNFSKCFNLQYLTFTELPKLNGKLDFSNLEELKSVFINSLGFFNDPNFSNCLKLETIYCFNLSVNSVNPTSLPIGCELIAMITTFIPIPPKEFTVEGINP